MACPSISIPYLGIIAVKKICLLLPDNLSFWDVLASQTSHGIRATLGCKFEPGGGIIPLG